MKIKPTIWAIAMMAILFSMSIPTMAASTEAQYKASPVSAYISEPAPLATGVTPEFILTSIEPEPLLNEEEIRLIALLVMAEAEGECETGQRLVIDTVLNRAEHPRFPDNIHDVVYQPNQYSGMEPPRRNQCWVKDELVRLVREEAANRTNSEVIFFRTGRYGKYGAPMFCVGHHYFSSY